MIKSFRYKETEKIFAGVFSRKFPADIQTRAFNKLAALHAALNLTEFVSIWNDNNAEDLEICRLSRVTENALGFLYSVV